MDHDNLKGRFTFPLILSILATGFGSCFIFGYNIGVMNAAGTKIKRWIADCQHWSPPNDTDVSKMTDKEYIENLSKDNKAHLMLIWSVVVGIFPLGGMFGGLLTGFIADRFGRKIGMLMNNSLTILAGIVMACSEPAGTFILLIVGRFLIGINAGLNSGLAPMYLTEIAPVNYRGLLGSVNQLMVTVAILTANILGLDSLLGTNTLWPFLLAFTIVPAVWQLSVLPCCPESPKFLLITKNEEIKARKALITLRGTKAMLTVEAEMNIMKEEQESLKSTSKIKFTTLFTDRLLRWAMILAVMMMLSQQMSGINVAMFYSTQIFENDAKLSTSAAIAATLATMAVNVLMTFISAVLVDNAGRRTLQLAGLGGMWLSSYLLVISLELTAQKVSWAAYFSIVFVIAFVISFATGPGSIPWFYVSELFEQNARGHANSVAVGTNWFACFVVGILFPPIQHGIGQFTFLIYTVSLTFFWIFTFIYVPETKGKTIEEVTEELRQSLTKGERRNKERDPALLK